MLLFFLDIKRQQKTIKPGSRTTLQDAFRYKFNAVDYCSKKFNDTLKNLGVDRKCSVL